MRADAGCWASSATVPTAEDVPGRARAAALARGAPQAGVGAVADADGIDVHAASMRGMAIPPSFPGWWITDARQGATFTQLSPAQLGEGAVTVRVRCSSLNYKDALAVRGTAPVVRTVPLVPGIDLAGEVVASDDPALPVGTSVIATGGGLGETRSGGLAAYCRCDPGLLLTTPAELDGPAAMAFGTAGLTAMLGVMALEAHGLPPRADVVVTGATGGVGSCAVRLLAQAGHRVSAISGKADQTAYLRALGASEVLPRAALVAHPERALVSERWQAAIDAVGGELLAGLLRAIRSRGAVATCGMAAGGALPTTVYPFILRGVALLGIASASAPRADKEAAWARLARGIPASVRAALVRTIPLAEVGAASDALLGGRVTGRYVVAIDG